MKLRLISFLTIIIFVLLDKSLALWPKVVREGSVALLERFGEYKQTLSPGLHWIIPIVDSCRTMSMKERVLDTPPQNCVTLDNAPVKVDAVMYFKIFDPVRACYNIQDLDEAMSNLVKTQVRSEIGKLDLDSTFSARQTLGTTLLSSMKECVDEWGIQVTRVEILPQIVIFFIPWRKLWLLSAKKEHWC
jgi:regulator of protease activity HflC (stomatin/prohibitin superfamily)